MSSFWDGEALEAIVVQDGSSSVRRHRSSEPACNPDTIRRQSISQSEYFLFRIFFIESKNETAIAQVAGVLGRRIVCSLFTERRYVLAFYQLTQNTSDLKFEKRQN
jgi:hypothetical protein